MATKDLGVNIRRYMKTSGITAKTLAAKSGIGPVALSNIINGKSIPRSSTLVHLCKVLGQGPDKLLADNKEISSLRFRTQKTLTSREIAARDLLISEIGRWLDDYIEIEHYLDIKNKDKLPNLESFSPSNAAEKVRKIMSCDPDSAINSIVAAVENMNIKLKFISFGFSKLFGLSIHYEDGGPAIIINNEHKISIERQIFTIAHELGHLVLHKENPNSKDYDKQENEADKFASELLMPQKAFEQEWERLKGFDWKDRVLIIKRLFKVSYKTVIRRITETMPKQIKERNLYIEFSIWYKEKYNHDLKDHYEPEAICAVVEPNSINAGPVELESSRFHNLVRKAFEDSHISLSRTSEILGISLAEMNTLASSWKNL